MNEAPPQQRITPRSDLDFNLMIIETVWGNDLMPQSLKEDLIKKYQLYDDEGNPLYTEEGTPLLSKKAFSEVRSHMKHYTRDLRLSNLSKADEIPYCAHYLDLSSAMVKEGYSEAFHIALSKVATITELAQSKGGFLRRQMHTVRTENVDEILEPKKKGIFGGRK